MADFDLSLILILVGVIGAALTHLEVIKPGKKDATTAVLLILAAGGVLGKFGVINFMAGGAGGAPDQGPTVNWANTIPKVIDALNWQTKTWGANSYTTVTATANYYMCDANGVVCDNPSNPNVNPVDSGSISSGVVSDTSALVRTNTWYRVTLDGSTTYYDQYLETQNNAECTLEGICRFIAPPTDAATIGKLIATFNNVVTIATLDDMFEEGGYADNTSWINGQSHMNLSVSTVEIGCTNHCADGDVLIYDESQGDGSWWIKLSISFSGANKRAKEPALCFDWEDGAQPEGNEFSAITAQLISGTSLGMPSSLLGYFNKESCVPLGSYQNGGISAEYKLIFDVDEANLDTNDDFKITLDDNGKINGKDIHLGTKASAVSIDIDAQP